MPRQEVWETSAHAAATLPNAAEWIATRYLVRKRLLLGVLLDHIMHCVLGARGVSASKPAQSCLTKQQSDSRVCMSVSLACITGQSVQQHRPAKKSVELCQASAPRSVALNRRCNRADTGAQDASEEVGGVDDTATAKSSAPNITAAVQSGAVTAAGSEGAAGQAAAREAGADESGGAGSSPASAVLEGSAAALGSGGAAQAPGGPAAAAARAPAGVEHVSSSSGPGREAGGSAGSRRAAAQAAAAPRGREPGPGPAAAGAALEGAGAERQRELSDAADRERGTRLGDWVSGAAQAAGAPPQPVPGGPAAGVGEGGATGGGGVAGKPERAVGAREAAVLADVRSAGASFMDALAANAAGGPAPNANVSASLSPGGGGAGGAAAADAGALAAPSPPRPASAAGGPAENLLDAVASGGQAPWRAPAAGPVPPRAQPEASGSTATAQAAAAPLEGARPVGASRAGARREPEAETSAGAAAGRSSGGPAWGADGAAAAGDARGGRSMEVRALQCACSVPTRLRLRGMFRVLVQGVVYMHKCDDLATALP